MIRPQMWKRLESTRISLRCRHVQHIFVIMRSGETIADVEAKVERWKAGEKVDGISAKYEGGEVDYGLPIEFVDPPPRDEDGKLIDV